MYTGTTIFSQVMRHLPWHRFHRIVQHYRGDYKVKSFRCADHYRVMAFAQLTFRESLRDIEACLRAMRSKLFHMGIRSTVSRNNLSNANERRDWRIYAEFAQVLIAEARRLYTDEDLGVDLNATVYALDSTTIDLCLSVFPWARFRRTKGAIKLHTLLNLHGAIPEFVLISDGKLHDVHALDHLIPCPGAYYIMDRGYLDLGRLYRLHTARSLFVTRAKANFKFRRRYSHPVDRTTGLICDQTVLLSTFYPAKAYPEPLRRIKFFDVTTDLRLVFLTNDFASPALTIVPALQAPLADRTVLQMDQAASPHQGLLRHQSQCRENTNLDRPQHLPAHRHHPQAPLSRVAALHNSPGPERLALRENPHSTGLSGHGLHYSE